MVLRGREGGSPYQPTPKEKRGFGCNCYLWDSGYNGRMNTCEIEGCNNKHHARGYCYRHYWAYRTTGDADNARDKRGRRPKGEEVKLRVCGLNDLLTRRWGE